MEIAGEYGSGKSQLLYFMCDRQFAKRKGTTWWQFNVQ